MIQTATTNTENLCIQTIANSPMVSTQSEEKIACTDYFNLESDSEDDIIASTKSDDKSVICESVSAILPVHPSVENENKHKPYTDWTKEIEVGEHSQKYTIDDHIIDKNPCPNNTYTVKRSSAKRKMIDTCNTGISSVPRNFCTRCTRMHWD